MTIMITTTNVDARSASATDISPAKSVRFGRDVTIREYALEIGDSPACSSGIPIQLGWRIQRKSRRSLELYEYFRTAAAAAVTQGEASSSHSSSNISRTSRRRRGLPQRRSSSPSDLKIPPEERTKMLLRAGFTPEHIADALFRIHQDKQERNETLKAEGIDHLWIVVLDKFGRLPAAEILKPAQKMRKARPALSSLRSDSFSSSTTSL